VGLVCLGNLLGSAAFAAFATVIGPALGVVQPAAFVGLSKLVTAHPPWVLLVGSILVGWLMGLLS
jgi:predicted membrane-bound spermidine synthase